MVCSNDHLTAIRRRERAPSTSSAAVPLYRFGIRDGERFEDHECIDLPDNVTARTHAMGIIQELRKATKPLGEGSIGWCGRYRSTCRNRTWTIQPGNVTPTAEIETELSAYSANPVLGSGRRIQ